MTSLDVCLLHFSSTGSPVNGPINPQIPAGEAAVNDIALNHSGRTFYSAAGDKVRVWDTRK